jgi:hypothetical protein
MGYLQSQQTEESALSGSPENCSNPLAETSMWPAACCCVLTLLKQRL